MPRTYEGTLKGNRIEWSDDAPVSDETLRVRVTVLEEDASDADRGRRMADALRRLAERDAFAGIDDPVAWQRSVREERPLPGRGGGE